MNNSNNSNNSNKKTNNKNIDLLKLFMPLMSKTLVIAIAMILVITKIFS